MSSELEANNPCPHGEIPANNVNLTYDHPVPINLRISPYAPTVDVILLIDATASVKPHLQAIKPELISFLNNIEDGMGVGVAVYGAEQFFDSSGKSILSAVDADVNKAIQALDRIPEYADGPRTTLRALEELKGSDMGTRGRRQIVFLIGDSPGREPECGSSMTRDTVAWDIFGYSSSVSVIPISVGQPGLDAGLPEPPTCPNNEYVNTAPIAQGQATFFASNTAGVVIDTVTAETLASALDTVRRNPLMPSAQPPGSSIGVTTARLPIYSGPYTPPFQAYTNGCEDAVLVDVNGIPDFISAPNVVNATITLRLKPGVCGRGVRRPCEVRIREHVNTAQPPNVWNRPLIRDEIIYVHAC
ncbi:von Willebrand factor A-like protein [Gracilaria domingensis]|nr:von Willebrand factor A-like protein [Gracilaria domingensis]